MKRNKLSIKNREGHELAAYIELPVDRHPHNFAIFAHCFTCSKNLKAIRHIARSLTSAGFGVLSMDFTGLGESEGTFSDTNFSSNVSDIEAVADYLEEHYKAPTLLIGHSLGGAAAIQAASNITSVGAVATIAAPSEPEHVKHLFDHKEVELEKKGYSEVNIGGRPFRIKKQFVEDLQNKSLSGTLQNLDAALMILHSPQDKIVGIDNAAELFKNARHSKSFISLDGADHLLSDKKDSIYAGEVIGSWAKRYIDTADKNGLRTDAQTVAKLGSPEEKFTTQIKSGKHTILSDEPEKAGGLDLGPSPYELLNASLGACTAMTLRMYANHKKWDLQEVKVHLTHTKKHDEDCRDCDNENAKVDYIYRELEVEGELDKKQKQKLVEIADKCPVHKTLHGPIRIKTKLLDQSSS